MKSGAVDRAQRSLCLGDTASADSYDDLVKALRNRIHKFSACARNGLTLNWANFFRNQKRSPFPRDEAEGFVTSVFGEAVLRGREG